MAARRKRNKRSTSAARARQNASRPSTRLAEAEQALREDDCERAIFLATAVLVRKDAASLADKAQQILAESYFRRAAETVNLRDRLKLLEQALQYAPADPRLHYHRGLTLLALGESSEAEDALAQAVQNQPDRPGLALLQQLARAAGGMAPNRGELSPAEVHALQLALLFAKDAPTEEIESQLQQLSAGMEDAAPWQELLAMRDDPNAAPELSLSPPSDNAGGNADGSATASPMLGYYCGVAALRRDDLETALDAWRFLAASGLERPWMQDNFNGLLRERAVALADEGRWQDVVHLYEGYPHAADDRILNETVAAALFHLGYAAAQAGDWPSASVHWQRANDLNSSRYLAQNLALSQEALEDWEAAALAWREMVRRRPRKETHPDYLSDAQVSAIWAHAAECYAKAEMETEGDYYPLYEEKLTCLKNAIKYAPDNLALRTGLVDAYLEEDRSDAAANELERMLKADGDYVPALVRLGIIRAEQWGGNPIPLWERALRLEPDNTDARDALAGVIIEMVNGEGHYVWRGRFDPSPRNTIRKLEETLELVPDHPQLLFELGRQYMNVGKEREALDALRQSWESAPSDVRSVGNAMHELLHVEGGDKVVDEKLPSVRQLSGLRPMFWISQGDAVLNCELDEQWAVRFWDEAADLAAGQRGPDTLAFTLVGIIESASVGDAGHLSGKYEERLRRDAPNSGALEFVEAFKAFNEHQDRGKATRLLRTAQRKASKAGDTQMAAKAEQISDMINGRTNPLLGLLGGLSGAPGGLADLLDDMDIDPEEFMDDFFKNL